jgi:cytochrome c oxidase subunit II
MSTPSRSRTGSGLLAAALITVVVIAAVVIALAAAGVTPQGLVNSFLPVQGSTPGTEQGRATRSLYDVVFTIGAVIFFLVEGMIVFTVVRYRRKPTDTELPPQTHGNNVVEVIWTAIPTAIVLFLFVMSWQTLNQVDATGPTQVHVRAVAQRYQWTFDYLDANGNTVFTQQFANGADGGLELPVGEPILVSLRSMDVIHAFYVPKFLFKRDVIPGRENTFDFTIDDIGTYRGQCAELCGAGHGQMLFEVHAVSQADYTAWLAASIAKANATPPPAPSGAATGQVLELVAQNLAFGSTALQAPAGKAFTIHFVNQDASVPHNVEIKDAAGAQVFKGSLLTGPGDVSYTVPALAAGSYTFNCTVHPNMTGTLTVQ